MMIKADAYSKKFTAQVFLSRRNLLTLLAKLDEQQANGEQKPVSLMKRDWMHPVYPQSHSIIMVNALEDDEYYTDRNPGPSRHAPKAVICKK